MRPRRRLETQAMERLREQLAVATVRMSDAQILDLADSLHETLRRRRYGAAEARSWRLCTEDE
jgi:hypothetical protein